MSLSNTEGRSEPKPKPALAQKGAEQYTDGACQRAETRGAIKRGEFEAARMQIENHLAVKAMIESGEYKRHVADALNAGKLPSQLTTMEPLEAFLKMSGISRDTFDRREKELRALGAESVATLRTIGVPYRDIRLLAEAPDEIQKEVRRIAQTDPEGAKGVINALLSTLLEERQAHKKARQAVKDAEHAQEVAEKKLRGVQEKVIVRDEEIKKLQAEAKEGHRRKIVAENDAEILLAEFRKRVNHAFIMLADADIDWDATPYTTAQFELAVSEFEARLRGLRVQYLTAIAELPPSMNLRHLDG